MSSDKIKKKILRSEILKTKKLANKYRFKEAVDQVLIQKSEALAEHFPDLVEMCNMLSIKYEELLHKEEDTLKEQLEIINHKLKKRKIEEVEIVLKEVKKRAKNNAFFDILMNIKKIEEELLTQKVLNELNYDNILKKAKNMIESYRFVSAESELRKIRDLVLKHKNLSQYESVIMELINNVKRYKNQTFIKILEYEADHNKQITKLDLRKDFEIPFNEVDYYYELLNSEILISPEESKQLRVCAQEVIDKIEVICLLNILKTGDYDIITALKVGKYLEENDWISSFHRIPISLDKEVNDLEFNDIIIFISYATADAEKYQIKEIAEKLTKFSHIQEALYWEEDLHDNIYEYMNENLGKCDLMILFCSQNALKSIPVNKEWTAADALNKPIIPIFSEIEEVPPLLSSRRGIKFHFADLNKCIKEIYDLILKKLSD